MAERSFKSEVAKLRLGAGQEFRGEGILAVTKALLQSGVSYVSGYQGAPISHLVDVLADADDVLRDLGIRFEASANEAAAAAALAASINYPLRGAATFKATVGHQRRLRRARQSRLQRRHRRRAHHRRRGLRRRLLDHAGAQPRLRDEVADLAARPASEPAVDRAGGGERLRAVGGVQHAGDAGAAHPRLPRLRQLHRPRQCAPGLHARGRARAPRARRQPHRAAARELPAREGKGREALAGGRALHRSSTSSTSCSTATPTTSASSCRAACTIPRCARSKSSGSPTCSATAAFRSTCSTSPIR